MLYSKSMSDATVKGKPAHYKKMLVFAHNKS